ncbi:TPA: hypothetical protein ACOEAK_003166 [Enterobacter ludwigii]
MEVEARGKTFTFPEGTSHEEIGLAIDDYFANKISSADSEKMREQEDNSFTDFMGGVVSKMVDAGVGVSEFFGNELTPDEQRQIDEMKRRLGIMKEYSPTATTLGEVAGAVVPAIIAWETGGALTPGIAGAGRAATVGTRLLKGAGGSVAAQAISGEVPTLSTTATDVAINEAVGMLFGAPGKFLNAARGFVGRPSDKVMAAAERIGASPSLAVASGGKGSQMIENLIAKSPGGAGVLQSQHEKEFEAIDNFIKGMKERYGTQGDSTQLGQEVIRGLNVFTKQFTNRSEELYGKLWQAIPQKTRAEVPAFTAKLEEIAGRYKDDPEIAELLNDPFVMKLLSAVKGKEKKLDTETEDILYSFLGQVPEKAKRTGGIAEKGAAIDSIKALRTRIGASFDRPELLSRNLDEADRMALYSALTEDLEKAAAAVGPEALKAWKNANRYWAAGRNRIDSYLNPLAKLQSADNVYKNLFGAEGKGTNAMDPGRAAALMKSLPEDVRGKVISEVIQRAGEARAGAQGAAGGEFSPAVFLTNWNKLPAGSKKVLFSDAATRADIDALAVYSDALKKLGREANFSNTAQNVSLGALLFGAITNPVVGVPVLAGTVGSSYVTAKMMTSPKFINWMRKTTESASKEDLGRNVGKLIALYWDHPLLRDDISQYVNNRAED